MNKSFHQQAAYQLQCSSKGEAANSEKKTLRASDVTLEELFISETKDFPHPQWT